VRIKMTVKSTVITISVATVMSVMSVLFMRGYALSQPPEKVATWAALATVGMLACLLVGLAIGYTGARERIIGIEQGTAIMARSAETVLDVRKSMPPAQPIVIRNESNAPTAPADVVVRPRSARPDKMSVVDVVDMG